MTRDRIRNESSLPLAHDLQHGAGAAAAMGLMAEVAVDLRDGARAVRPGEGRPDLGIPEHVE